MNSNEFIKTQMILNPYILKLDKRFKTALAELNPKIVLNAKYSFHPTYIHTIENQKIQIIEIMITKKQGPLFSGGLVLQISELVYFYRLRYFSFRNFCI